MPNGNRGRTPLTLLSTFVRGILATVTSSDALNFGKCVKLLRRDRGLPKSLEGGPHCMSSDQSIDSVGHNPPRRRQYRLRHVWGVRATGQQQTKPEKWNRRFHDAINGARSAAGMSRGDDPRESRVRGS